jgi:fructokinase
MGSARGLDDVVYITVGTGIGGGALAGGRLVHGLQHRRLGHMRLPHDRAADPSQASAVSRRHVWKAWRQARHRAALGHPARDLPPDHPAWRLEARYLAAGVVNMVCTLSPRRVIMGGGVMEQAHLFPMIREEVAAS